MKPSAPPPRERWPESLASAPVRLLIAAGRAGLGLNDSSETIDLTHDEWMAVPDLAHRHGLIAWAHALVRRRSDAPDEVKSALAVAAQTQAVEALRGIRELDAIRKRLREFGIASVAIKGPTLGLWLYGSASGRTFTDLDVLIAFDERVQAVTVLEELGYRRPHQDSRTADALYAGRSAWPLAHARAYPVDLHWRLSDAAFRMPLTAGEVIARARALTIGDAAVDVPSPNHAASLTFAHAAKHGWCGLELILALAYLMGRPDVDWNDVLRVAIDSGTVRGLTVGARLAELIFGVTAPPPVASAARKSSDPSLTTLACDLLGRPPGSHASRWEERRLHRGSLDRRRDRIRYEALRLVMPTPIDGAWCPLPPWLAGLYGPIRIVRLALAGVAGRLRA